MLFNFVNNLPLIFFYPRICFYGETGNEAEADEDHQRGREKGWNENEGILQTVGNDKDINTKNEKGYSQHYEQAETKPPVESAHSLFHFYQGAIMLRARGMTSRETGVSPRISPSPTN